MTKKLYVAIAICFIALLLGIYFVSGSSNSSTSMASESTANEVAPPEADSIPQTSSEEVNEISPPVESEIAEDSSAEEVQVSQEKTLIEPQDETDQIIDESQSDGPKLESEPKLEVEQEREVIPQAAEESAQSNGIINYVVMISLIINIILAFTAFTLFRWRKLVVNDEKTLMPEQWVNSFGSEIVNLSQVVGQLVNGSSSNSKKLNDLGEILETFNRSLDDKDKEIKRYKQGYDAYIYKRFVRKFILITASLKDLLDKGEPGKVDLEAIHFRLEDALEDCGIEIRDIELGSDYRKLGDLAEDNPQSCPTDNEDQHFKVAEVIRPAYVIANEDRSNVIIPAKVKVYLQN